MTATNIPICADSALEARAQSVLADLGIDMTTAFNIFLTQVVEKETLPFEMMADAFDATQDDDAGWEPDPTKTPLWGRMKGKIWMADDFDAPMEEFEEYM